MSRWLALVDDPTVGGSTYDLLEGTSGLEIPAPTQFIPVTTAAIDPGLNPLDRKDEVRGRRGDTAPVSFSSAPKLTFSARAYPKLIRTLMAHALGGTPSNTGVAPAAIVSTLEPIQSDPLPAMVAWMLREGQLDRLTGLAVESVQFQFPIDKEGDVNVTMDALYHDVDPSGSVEDPNAKPGEAFPTVDYTGYVDTFMLRDAKAFRGSAEVEFPDLAGFDLTFNNGLIQDAITRFRPGHNIEKTTIESVLHKLWYPNRHKIGPQSVTGTLQLSDLDPTGEKRRLLQHADKLVFEILAGPAGTTPASTEMLKLVIGKHVLTGGGADPLVREGDIRSSYEFTGYIDEATNKDIQAIFSGKTAVTI